MKTPRRLAVIVPLVLVAEMSLLGTQQTFAQKLRVAYTAFAGTFTILWVGHDAGLYRKSRRRAWSSSISVRVPERFRPCSGATSTLCILRQAPSSMPMLAGADLVMIGCQYDQGQTSFFTTPAITNISGLKDKAAWGDPLRFILGFRCAPRTEKNQLQPVKDVAIVATGRDLRKSSPRCKRI